MHNHPLIFSDQARYRRIRHLLLWVLYATYFTIQSYYPVGSPSIINLHFIKLALLSTALYFPFCFLSVYVLLYYLYPRFLQKGRTFLFIFNFLLLVLAGIFINYWASAVFFYYRYSGIHWLAPRLFLGFHNVAIGIFISLFLLGVKLGRDGYVQQKANLELARQKARTELQLLKTRIDPQFLFHALDTLQVKIDSGDPEAPSAILELSDKLSSILYDRS